MSYANIRKKNIPGRGIIANGNIQDANMTAVFAKTIQNKTWWVVWLEQIESRREKEMRSEKTQVKSRRLCKPLYGLWAFAVSEMGSHCGIQQISYTF